MHAARSSVHRDLAGFDFEQAKVDRGLITELADLTFTAAAHNVVFIGGTGTGKTSGSACFVAGFSSVFAAFGASATMLGQLLLEYRNAASVAGGSVIIAFGLLMTGFLPLQLLQRDFRLPFHISGGTPRSAYAVGVAFGFGWTPCIGPVLGAILMLSAISSSLAVGVLLLATYSLGLGIPLLVAAAFTDRRVARNREVKRIGRVLYYIAGAIMIVTGIAMISGHLSMFAIWLLQRFPVLGKVG